MADEQVVDTSTPAATTTAPTPDASSGQQNALSPSAPPGPAPGQQAAEAERNRGILADLQKERKARQQYEQQAQHWQAQYQQEQRRVQALAGVNPQSEEQAEIAAVRARFSQIYPELAGLTKDDIDAIRQFKGQSANLEAATAHHWESHGRKMLDNVTTEIAKTLGGNLSQRQISRIEQAYVAEAEANPEFLARHDRGDSTLIAEFVKNWDEDFLAPARRNALAAEVGRQRFVPSGKDRSVAGPGGKTIDVNDSKAVEDLLVAGFKERGGAFGR